MAAGSKRPNIMNLLLLSKGAEYLKSYLKPQSKIAFIPNAGDVCEDRQFVTLGREYLKASGFDILVFDLRENSNFDILNECDAIYTSGGNCFYLLSLMKKTGFDVFLKNWIEQNKIYIGSSAGSCIMGTSLEPYKTLDDPQLAPDLESYDALSIVDYVIIPHFGREKYTQRHQAIIAEYDSKYNLILLDDDSGLLFSSPSQYQKIVSFYKK